uniref:C-type lectin domain-containing protein n=1 Tax=Chrysemys picta bellii TaxID=8478 RepID=A0A8C3I1L4_CHRPI
LRTIYQGTPPCPRCLPHVTAACPDGWVGYQGNCYYFSETEGNWNNSQSHCSSLNASLASIDSVPELLGTCQSLAPPEGLRQKKLITPKRDSLNSKISFFSSWESGPKGESRGGRTKNYNSQDAWHQPHGLSNEKVSF